MTIEFDVISAQSLCDLIWRNLGYGCSLSDRDGVVVASSDRQHVGGTQPHAACIMRREVDVHQITKEEANSEDGTKEGVNFGVDLAEDRIASCGIAGPLEQVEPLVPALRLFVQTMMLRDQGDLLRDALLNALLAGSAKNEMAVG